MHDGLEESEMRPASDAIYEKMTSPCVRRRRRLLTYAVSAYVDVVLGGKGKNVHI